MWEVNDFNRVVHRLVSYKSTQCVRIAEIFFTPTLLLVTKEVDSSPFTRGRQSLANREGCVAEEMPQLARRKS